MNDNFYIVFSLSCYPNNRRKVSVECTTNIETFPKLACKGLRMFLKQMCTLSVSCMYIGLDFITHVLVRFNAGTRCPDASHSVRELKNTFEQRGLSLNCQFRVNIYAGPPCLFEKNKSSNKKRKFLS